jgi:AraC-like DNA-binding protein
LNFARNLTPGLFMLLCFTLFAQPGRFPRFLLALFAIQILLEEPARLLVSPAWPFAHLVTQVIPTLLQMSFAVFAMWWALADWRSDLVESRRRARILTVVVIGLNVIASSLLLRVVISPDSVANYHAHVLLVAFNLAILVFVLFNVSQGHVEEYLDPKGMRAVPLVPPANVPDPDLKTLARLKSLFEIDRIYREAGLSLKDLADRVGVPEYRLRKLIHEHLGYTHYNAFLHGYRIREACEQLKDPAMRRIPILTIALSTGFQSVNTFNRAFRDIHGVTPSAYRTQHGGAGISSGDTTPETEK